MLENLRSFIHSCAEKWRQPGLHVSVVSKDDVLLSYGVGVLKLGQSRPVTSKSIFALASCSKSFATATVARLVDDQKLSWDDKVIDCLPYFELSDPYVTQNVSIRDLLCNRLGITSSEGRHRALCQDRKDLIKRLKYHPFRHSFRGEYGYCTDAFSLIGELVSEVSGEDWADFAARTIWSPLNMQSTNASWRAYRDVDALAQPHIWGESGFTAVPWTYEDHVATPAGGVNASGEDLGLWLQYWLMGPTGNHDSILSQESFQEILKPHTPERGPFADREFYSAAPPANQSRYKHEAYAMGWYVQEYAGITMYHHIGSIEGFRSAMAFSHDLNLGVCVLANADNQYLPRAIVQGIFDHVLNLDTSDWIASCFELDYVWRNENTSTPLISQDFDVCEAQKYEGIYADDGRFGSVRIFIKNSCLKLSIGEAQFTLKLCEKGKFLAYPDNHPHRSYLMAIRFRQSAYGIEGYDTDCGTTFHRSKTEEAETSMLD